MRDYQVFGGALRSDIEFPELRTIESDAPSWTLRTVATAPDMTSAQLLGQAEILPGFHVKLFSHERGFRFVFDDTGTFDITDNGREIAWTAGPHFEESWVRADVTGRVMAVALHASGHLCLHGSAVAARSGAIAFLAPKFHGKSTLALALTRAGAKLLTDDLVPVDPRTPIQAVPGVHQVKLWQDSASHFGVERETPRPGSKHLLHDFDDTMLSYDRTPLAAIYLLAPIIVEEGAAAPTVTRARMHSVASALALVRHSMMGSMLSGIEAQHVIDRATTVAEAVPVYQLAVTAGMERIGETVDQLLAWHGGAAVAGARA
ncbi:MAG TPA: hypothetical protein VK511_12895 [Gemmatimonadaceae bacterium]|nr:hypothetical protein [Gemmatimonadaceae bacterium]